MQEGDNCKRTSYNGNIRKHFAGIGYTYDAAFDVFIPPQPYPSWKLNYTTFVWESPIIRPDKAEGGVPLEGYAWQWFEYNQEWVQVKIRNVIKELKDTIVITETKWDDKYKVIYEAKDRDYQILDEKYSKNKKRLFYTWFWIGIILVIRYLYKRYI